MISGFAAKARFPRGANHLRLPKNNVPKKILGGHSVSLSTGPDLFAHTKQISVPRCLVEVAAIHSAAWRAGTAP